MVVVDRINLTNGPSDSGEGRWQTRCTGRSPRICADRSRREIRPGSQLPTELELRDNSYNASRNTVRDAIKWLTTLGLVETRPGQGTFVVQKIDPFVTTLSGDPKTGFGGGEGTSYMSEVTNRKRTPTTSESGRDPGGRATTSPRSWGGPTGAWSSAGTKRRFHRRHLLVDADVLLPDGFRGARCGAAHVPEDIAEGTVQYLADTLGIHQVGYRDWLAVRAPDGNETDFFKLSSDGRTSIVEISRTAFDGNGQPMRLTVTVYPADRNQFIIDFGQVPEQETDRET